ncbi:hypothetical protein BDQ17DRAFT_1178454, partial [Cyathus striatus]
APRTFKGEYSEVVRFIRNYDRLLDMYNVTEDKDKCELIKEYVSPAVERFIDTSDHMKEAAYSWKGLREEILNYYDAERGKAAYMPEDLVTFATYSSHEPIMTLDDWKKYFRDYKSIAGYLKDKNHITSDQYNGYFWMGIPEDLRNLLETKLVAGEPTHDMAKPWTVQRLQKQQNHTSREVNLQIYYFQLIDESQHVSRSQYGSYLIDPSSDTDDEDEP